MAQKRKPRAVTPVHYVGFQFLSIRKKKKKIVLIKHSLTTPPLSVAYSEYWLMLLEAGKKIKLFFYSFI